MTTYAHLRFYDTLQLPTVTPAFTPSAVLGGGGGKALLVRIAATHAGRLTGNFTFYPPQAVQDAANTFIKPYPRPVLINHDESSDPVGRVQAVRYVDLSARVLPRYQGLDRLLQGPADKETLLTLARTLKPEFHNHDYQGLGYLECVARISDAAAVEKILDGRYLTVSVGFVARQVMCSVCHADWVKDGRCDHLPGKTYDGDACFLIACVTRYDELSFVNRPADNLAGIIEIIGTDGARERLEVPGRKPDFTALYDLYLAGPSMLVSITDAQQRNLYDLQPVVQELQLLMSANQQTDVVEVVQRRLQDATLEVISLVDQQMIVEAHNELHSRYDYQVTDGLHDSSVPHDILSLHAKLHQTAMEGNFVGALALGALDRTLKLFGVERPEDMELQQEDSLQAQEAQVQDAAAEEELPDLETLFDEEVCYQLLAQELEAMADELEQAGSPEEAARLRDAKLTTAQRKRLKASTFCGPNRSFPVPDCAHVTAARRLIGRYKGPGSKSAILACVARKAKAMGCDKGKDSVVSQQPCCPGVEHRNLLLQRRQELLTRLQAEVAAIDEELRALYDFQPEEFCPRCRERQEELTAMRRAAQVEAHHLEALEMDLQIAARTEQQLRQNLAQALARQILVHRQLHDGRVYPQEEWEAQLQVLCQRSLETLECNLADMETMAPLTTLLERRVKGMGQNPQTTAVPDPTLAQPDSRDGEEPDANRRLINNIVDNYNTIARIYGRNMAQYYLENMSKLYPQLDLKGGIKQ